MIFKDVQADRSVGIDVWVVNFCGEVDFWWSEWVIGGEVDVQEEDSSLVGSSIGAYNACLPVEYVVLNWSCINVFRWVLLNVEEFLLNSFLGHI